MRATRPRKFLLAPGRLDTSTHGMQKPMANPSGRPTLSPARATLLALVWPIFIEQGLRVLIGTVDTLMVSHIGDEAVAGLSVANQVVMLFIISFAFIGIGSSVVITHYLGAGDREGADRISATAIATNFWIGFGVSLLVTLFSSPMLRLMQLPAAPLVYAKPFLALMGGTLFVESMNISIAAPCARIRTLAMRCLSRWGKMFSILSATAFCFSAFLDSQNWA